VSVGSRLRAAQMEIYGFSHAYLNVLKKCTRYKICMSLWCTAFIWNVFQYGEYL